jgi:hypothetical protein
MSNQNVKRASQLRCRCGNTPEEEGFYPCDKDGHLRKETRSLVAYEQPRSFYDWPKPYLYACDRCGVIIDFDTAEVVGWCCWGGKPSDDFVEANL